MKLAVLLNVLFSLTLPAHAGLVGWVTPREASWDFIQSTGGMNVSAPVHREGRWFLPVEYEVHGTRTVTRRPTTINSAPHRCTWKVHRDGQKIFLRLKIALAEKNDRLTHLHEIPLKKLPPGHYEVFYDEKSESDPLIGVIEIPAEIPQ